MFGRILMGARRLECAKNRKPEAEGGARILAASAGAKCFKTHVTNGISGNFSLSSGGEGRERRLVFAVLFMRWLNGFYAFDRILINAALCGVCLST